MQARAGKAGENTGAVKQVHHRFGLCVLHQLKLRKRVLRRVGGALTELLPGLVTFGIFRVAADLDPEHAQPA